MKISGADRYAPDKVPQLEAHVDEQVANGTFNLDANLALLRMYQFSPGTAKVPIVVKILLKALTLLPGPEYRACLQLLPDRLQNDVDVFRVIQLASALETSKYTEFWAQATNARDLIQLVPGFYDAARAYIAQTLCLTFSRLTRAALANSLQLQGDTLANWIKERVASAGWTEVKAPGGDLIVLPKNESNRPVVKRSQEVIRYEQVQPVLRAVTVGF